MNDEPSLNSSTKAIPVAFVQRRLHSLTGLFFVLFLCEHLLTNSRAALFFGDDGKGFIQSVNFLQSLPFLHVIEVLLLAVPISIHGYFGILYFFEASFSTIRSDGTKPYLPFARNFAFTWQRLTALILVVCVIAHVVTMRFLLVPQQIGTTSSHTVTLTFDTGLETLAPRLHAKIEPIDDKTCVAITENFSTALLLLVRDTFKSYTACFLYTIFVLSACFHAANGLWTFCISWGISLNERKRKIARVASNLLGVSLAFLGLVAIWLTYFNLRA